MMQWPKPEKLVSLKRANGKITKEQKQIGIFLFSPSQFLRAISIHCIYLFLFCADI